MLPCQMILFQRKNYNINNLNNTVLVNNTQYNQTPTIKLTNQKDKYIQEKASPWKQKAFGIKTISKLQGGCGCSG